MLQGYIDDSGSDGTRNPFILAGYILPSSAWADFSDAWQTQLDRAPKIKALHMKDVARKDGEFIGMRDEFIRCKLNDLLGVISQFSPDGIYTMLDWEDWRSMLEQKVPAKMRNPYQLLFPGIFDSLLFYQKRKGIFPQKVDLDFDEQGSAGEFAVSCYPFMKKHSEPDVQKMLGRTPTMLDDEEVVALQAADLLAWNIRRKNDLTDCDRSWDWLYAELNKNIWLGTKFTQKSLTALATMIDNGWEPAVLSDPSV